MISAMIDSFFVICCFTLTQPLTSACKIKADAYKKYSDEERMLLSDNVIYGKDLKHINVTDTTLSPNYTTKAVVSVFAVLKKKVPIAATIEIRDVFPRSSCSGTTMAEKHEYLLMLKATESEDVFDLQEVNPLQTAAIAADDELLYQTVQVCGLNRVRPPDGQTPPKDPDLQRRRLQSLASKAANNETCQIIDIEPGNGAAGNSHQRSTVEIISHTLMHVLSVAIILLLL